MSKLKTRSEAIEIITKQKRYKKVNKWKQYISHGYNTKGYINVEMPDSVKYIKTLGAVHDHYVEKCNLKHKE